MNLAEKNMTIIATLDHLAQYGYLSGAGLLTTGAAAWYTAVRVTNRNAAKDREQRRETEHQRAAAARRDALARAVKTFHILYAEIWKDPDISYVRRSIYNDEEYKEIDLLLQKRNQVEYNNLTRQENNTIEKVDRFCSILIRVKSFSENEEMSERQRVLWKKLLEDFWLAKIKARRPAFYTYIINHWPELEEPNISPMPNLTANQNANPRRPSSSMGKRIVKFASFFTIAIVIVGPLWLYL